MCDRVLRWDCQLELLTNPKSGWPGTTDPKASCHSVLTSHPILFWGFDMFLKLNPSHLYKIGFPLIFVLKVKLWGCQL